MSVRCELRMENNTYFRVPTIHVSISSVPYWVYKPKKVPKCILQRINLKTPFISPKYIQKQQMHFTERVLYDAVAKNCDHSQPFDINVKT